MDIVILLLLIAGLVCFLIATFVGLRGDARVRINLTPLGLAFWILTVILQSFPGGGAS